MTEVTNEVVPQTQVAAQTEQKPEKVFNQDDLNRIIGQVKAETHDKARKELMQELQLQQLNQAQAQQAPAAQQPPAMQQQPAQMQQMQPAQNAVPPQMGMAAPGMPPQMQASPQAPMQQPQMQPGQPQPQYLTAESAMQLFAQQQQEMAKKAAGDALANQFFGKLDAGKNKYPDFEEKVAPLRQAFAQGQLAHIALMANGADNTADIIYDLANNKGKIGNLLSLAQQSPGLAQAEINNLSQSIKTNETAQQQSNPSEPLSHLKPSTSSADNSQQSISALRNMYRA